MWIVRLCREDNLHYGLCAHTIEQLLVILPVIMYSIGFRSV